MNISSIWGIYWKNNQFKIRVFIGLALLILVTIFIPSFFTYIEKRDGRVLNDWLLNLIPALDVSIPTFTIIWLLIIFMLFRCAQHPAIFLRLLWSYFFLLIGRMICLLLVPLNPPEHIIELKDPISNLFYGSKFIRKDLFFSGHTATLFIMYLCLEKKIDRKLFLTGSIFIAVLVLVQHIHYTIDVLGAFILSFLFVKLGRKISDL